MNKKIIHVMSDKKFNDMAIRQFEEAWAGIHEFWVTGTRLYLTKSPLARSCTPNDVIQQLSRADVAAVIFHSLPANRYALLRHIPRDKSVVWIGWGYDYYSFMNNDKANALVLPGTKKLYSSIFKLSL